MVAATLAYDKRRGASPARSTGAEVPKPMNLRSQRGSSTWVNELMPPAPNASGSPSLLYPKNVGDCGSFSHINDHPSSGGSSTSSSDRNDLLSLPSAQGTGHLRSTGTRLGISRPSHFSNPFTEVLKAPLRTIGKQGSTSHRKGFTLCMDEFPILGPKKSESNSRQVTCHAPQGQPTSGSGPSGGVVAQYEQRKSPTTGNCKVISSSNYEHGNMLRVDCPYRGDFPVPAARLPRESFEAEVHETQSSKICMPPPQFYYGHTPDCPPDENGMAHRGMAPYGPYKPAEHPGSSPMETSTHCYGLFVLNQEEAAGQGPGHGGNCPDDGDPCHPDVPADACAINQPPHILDNIKNDNSDAVQKQPIIKKDLALLEKIKGNIFSVNGYSVLIC